MAEERFVVTFDVLATQRVSVEISAVEGLMSEETRQKACEKALRIGAWEDPAPVFVDIRKARS